MNLNQESVLAVLRTVQDPDLHKDIVTLGFVKDVKIAGGEVDFTIELTTPACPVRDQMKAEAEQKVAALPGVTAARAKMTADVKARGGFGRQQVPGVRNIVAVGAGKGGNGFVGSELVLWQIRTFSLYWSSGGPPASHGPRESPGWFAK